LKPSDAQEIIDKVVEAMMRYYKIQEKEKIWWYVQKKTGS